MKIYEKYLGTSGELYKNVIKKNFGLFDILFTWDRKNAELMKKRLKKSGLSDNEIGRLRELAVKAAFTAMKKTYLVFKEKMDPDFIKQRKQNELFGVYSIKNWFSSFRGEDDEVFEYFKNEMKKILKHLIEKKLNYIVDL